MDGKEKDKVHNDADELDEQEVEEDVETGAESSAGTAAGKPNANKDTKVAGKTFTQDQVTRISTREKNQGRAAVYKELGIDPKDPKQVAAVKAFIDSQKTDDQKAAEKQREDQRAKDEAEQRATKAEAKAEAMMLGVQPQYVEDLVTLALAKMTEDSDLKTIIGEFKTKYPVWFGQSDSDDDKGGKDKGKGKTGQKGTGAAVKDMGKGKSGEKEVGLGARLAAQRKSGVRKSTYWGTNTK